MAAAEDDAALPRASFIRRLADRAKRFDLGYRRSRWLQHNIDEKSRDLRQLIDDRSHELRRVADDRSQDATRAVQSVLDEIRRIDERRRFDDQIAAQARNTIIRNGNRDSLRSGRPIRVLFLVHNIEVWSSLSPVHRRMTDDDRFEVTVASCLRRYPGSAEFRGEDVVSRGLSDEGVDHVRFREQDGLKDLRWVLKVNPDIIFRQSKWDQDIPPAFSTERLTFARLYYVSYGLMTLCDSSAKDDPSREFGYQLERFFSISEDAAHIARVDDPTKKKTMTVTGNPRVDYINETTPAWPIESGNDFRIIWSAHHTIFTGWNDFGAFLTTYASMLEYAKAHPDVDLLFSMHPGLQGSFERLARENPDEHERVERFMAEWRTLPNTGVLENGGYIPAMKASDLCITDGLSLLIEYQLTRKPLIYIERPDHTPFSEAGSRVMEGAHFVASDDMDGVWDLVDRFRSGEEDDKSAAQQRTIEFLNAEQSAADNIVDVIASDSYGPR